MGFPKAPKANLGAWSSGLPPSINANRSQVAQAPARKNAWSRPAPWANVRRNKVKFVPRDTPGPAPVVAQMARSQSAPVVEKKPEPAAVETPRNSAPDEFIKVVKSKPAPWANMVRPKVKFVPVPTQEPEPAVPAPGLPKKQTSSSSLDPVAIESVRNSEATAEFIKVEPAEPIKAKKVMSFSVPNEEVAPRRHSWTVTVEEVNWFEADEELTISSPPVAAPKVSVRIPVVDSTPKREEPAKSPVQRAPKPAMSREGSSGSDNWTTVARKPRYGRQNSIRGGTRSTPTSGRGIRPTTATRSAGPQRSYGARARPGVKPVWRRVGSPEKHEEEKSTSERMTSPTFSNVTSPAPSSRSEFVRSPTPSSSDTVCRTDSSSSVTEASTRPSVAQSDAQVQTVLDKMAQLGNSSSTWADEDEDMEW